MPINSGSNLMRILLVEDNHRQRHMILEVLFGKFEVDCAVHYTQAKEKIKKQQFDLVLLDLMLPERQGTEIIEDGSLGFKLLKQLREVEPLCPVVVISGIDDVSTVLGVLQCGIVDFVTKDALEDKLPIIVRRAELIRQGRVDNLLLRRYQHRDAESTFIYADKSMKQIDTQITAIAKEDYAVLLLGESGTGKEVIAREIHHRSPRCNDPFIDLNCGAIPEHLLESELFGFEKGAFTGADRVKVGLFELAHNGTLFLDEIGDLTPSMQVKLLRVLQEKTFRRIGGVKNLSVDVRIIAATNKNLTEEIQMNRFREDLFYRLSQVRLTVPTLRDRIADIPVLVKHFLKQSKKGEGVVVDAKAIKMLQRYSWLGNVRELESIVHRLLMVGESKLIGEKAVSLLLMQQAKAPVDNSSTLDGLPVTLNLIAIEKATIERALAMSANQKEAAKRLGIPYSTLRRKIREYFIRLTSMPNRLKEPSKGNSVETNQSATSRKQQLLKSIKGMDTFTTNDAQIIIGNKSLKTVICVLNDLIKQKQVVRVQKGIYRAI